MQWLKDPEEDPKDIPMRVMWSEVRSGKVKLVDDQMYHLAFPLLYLDIHRELAEDSLYASKILMSGRKIKEKYLNTV